jgi:hypothetical protein
VSRQREGSGPLVNAEKVFVEPAHRDRERSNHSGSIAQGAATNLNGAQRNAGELFRNQRGKLRPRSDGSS